MEIPSTRPDLICANRDGTDRYELGQVHLEVEKGRLVLTDGVRLVIVPVSCEPEDYSGFVSPRVLQQARERRLQTLKARKRVLVLGSNSKGEKERTVLTRKTKGNFPNYESILPRFNGPPTITLSRGFLTSLLQAISRNGEADTDPIDFWIGKPDQAILVASQGSSAIGVLMPMRGKRRTAEEACAEAGVKTKKIKR